LWLLGGYLVIISLSYQKCLQAQSLAISFYMACAR
jgi:hypothetical protein